MLLHAGQPVEPLEQAPRVAGVLQAIDSLLDAIEGLEAPLARELLGVAVMALVHECALTVDPAKIN